MPTKEYLEQLKEYLSYNADTGELTWQKSGSNRVKQGGKAGHLNKEGYIRVNFKGKLQQGHRIAWFLYYSRWPEKELDHINGIRNDNKISNLRGASSRQNHQNLRSHRNGKLFGCYFYKPYNKYRAQIKVNGKSKFIGYFNTEQEAHEAYKNYITKRELE